MKCRCQIDTLFGYCKESDGETFYISFISPCRGGIKLMCGESIFKCPNYLSFNKYCQTNESQNQFKDLIGGIKATQ